jgi:hypothetical protein
MILFFEKLRALLRRLLGWQEISPPMPEAPVLTPSEPPPEPQPEPQIVIAETIPKVPPRQRRRYTTRNLDREQIINWLLEFMSKAKPVGAQIPINYFDGADPVLDEKRHAALFGRDDTMFKTDLKPTQFPRFDVSVISLSTNDINPEIEEGVSLTRCRRASLRFLRGRGASATGFAVELSLAVVTKEFEYIGWHEYFTWTGGNNWAPVERNLMEGHGRRVDWVTMKRRPGTAQLIHDKEERAEWSLKIQLALADTEIRRQNWRVLLGFDGHPRIGFRTDPVGVREIFRLRDIPEGQKRRAALRHWVREHWRVPVSVEENRSALIHVREHLRGSTQFHWNGLSCSIIPSEIDRTRNLEEIVKPAILEVEQA